MAAFPKPDGLIRENQDVSINSFAESVVTSQQLASEDSEPFLSAQIDPNFFSYRSRHYWYLVRAKDEAFNHFLDLQTQYRDLSNVVFSWSRNYQLRRLENEISWARVSWESIQVPPFEEQFVTRVRNMKVTKEEEEVFIDELVLEVRQDVTLNSLPDAASDSDSISGSKTDSDK
ncbi:hypothetical protein MKW92_004709, partial [Papaver armeniacum]